jgi:predicted MPP superfamily phosphohydrolase
MFIFGFVLTAVGTLLHAYVFWRASSVPFLRRRLRARTIAVIGLVLWALFVTGRTVGHGAAGTAGSLFELLAMTWMGALFLVAVCLAATEIVTGFGFLFRRYAPMLRGWALIVGGAMAAIAVVQALRPPTVESYEVNVAGLPAELDGTVLVAISDLHLNSPLTRNWLENRVAQVQALHPDLIVLLGDIFEGHGPPKDELVAAMNHLAAPLGVWAVPGNHEHYGARGGASQPAVQSNFRVLRSCWVELKPGLVLAGVEDLTSARRSGPGNGLMQQALADRAPGATILLSHTPWQTGAAAERGVSLMLCAHTHGGQIWPFGYLVRTRYPLLAGRYEVNGMPVLVCRGTGTWGPCMRLWQRGEIMRVTLRAKPAQLGSPDPTSTHWGHSMLEPTLHVVEHTAPADWSRPLTSRHFRPNFSAPVPPVPATLCTAAIAGGSR